MPWAAKRPGSWRPDRWARGAWSQERPAGGDEPAPGAEQHALARVVVDVRRHLHDARAWAHARTLVNIEVGRSYLKGRGPYPERAAVNMVVGRFLDDFLDTVDRWAEWATEIIESWPEHPGDAQADPAAQLEAVQRAVDRAARWRRQVLPIAPAPAVR